MTATFGRLYKQTLELSDGLNILEAPNESGKSTWCAFLNAMFYGINSRERNRGEILADKNRYAPWNGAAMEGRLDCLTSDRQNLTLLRQTKRSASPMGEFQALYTGTGNLVSDLHGDSCGETLLGVPKEVFERSAFIRQSGLGITQSAELERRILSLVTSGEEDTSYLEVSAALKKQLNRRRHNKTGEIPILEEKLDAVKHQRSNLAAQQSALVEAQKHVEVLKGRESDLERQLELYRRSQTVREQNALHAAENAAKEARRRADGLQTQLNTDQIPENETIGRLRGAIVNLETARKATVQAREQRDTAQKALLRVEKAVQETPFAGKTVEEAKQIMQAPPSVHPGSHAYLLPVLIGWPAFFALGAFYWKSLPANSQELIFPVLLVAAAGILFVVSRHMKHTAIRRAQADALLRRFGTSNPEELSALVDTYSSLLSNRNNAQTAAAAAKAAAESLNASLTSNEQAILLEVRRFAPSAFDIPTADQLLRECAVRRKECSGAESAAKEAQLRCEILAQRTSPGEYSPEDLHLAIPTDGNPETSAQALEDVRSELSDARSEADHLAGKITAAGDSAELDAQEEQLQKQLAVLNEEYHSITLALHTLEEANTTLQNRFSPALGRCAAQIFSELTGGHYTGVILDRTLHLSAEPRGNSIYRDAHFLSTGAVDQLYLAVRLAICKLILPANRGIPIILDDALTNFDDARCATALRWLRREAETRQILLFTCHSREAEFFRSDPAVSIHKLTNPPSVV